MLGFLGTMEAAKEAGMWDLIMYTGGVSGSCWALGCESLTQCFPSALVRWTADLPSDASTAYYTWGEMSTKRALSHFAKHSMQSISLPARCKCPPLTLDSLRSHPLSPKAMRETMKSPRGPYFLLAPL